MEKFLKFSLKLALIVIISCDSNQPHSSEENKILSMEYYKKGEGSFSQGSYESVYWINKAIEMDSTNSNAWWELSIPYLKRGLPHNWKPLIDKTVSLDPARWQGWRGYEKLFFYRDYNSAIEDFNATDTLTPNYTDYPQGMSVDYLRGLAYYGLHDFPNSLRFIDKYIQDVTNKNGEKWVDVYSFIYRGIVQDSLGEKQKAIVNFKKCLQYYENSSDAHYHLARLYLDESNLEEARQHVMSARKLFQEGYFMQRPFVESFCQIYEEDIDSLELRIKRQQ